MNERGVTLIDTMFGLVVLCVVGLALMPMLFRLQQTLYDALLQVHVSEAAYNGAKEMLFFGKANGHFEIEGQSFYWAFEGEEICVTYTDLKGEAKRCVGQSE